MRNIYYLLLCLIGLNIVISDAKAQIQVYANQVIDHSTDFLEVSAIVDTDPANYCYLSSSVGILSSSHVRIGFPQTGKAGDMICFDVQGNGLLNLALLNNCTIELYDESNAKVATASGGNALDLELSLSATNVYTMRYMTDVSASYKIKSAKLIINNVLSVNLLDEFRIYNAYIQTPCTSVLATSVHSKSSVGLSNVENAERSVSADQTDFATINVALGLLSSSHLDLAFSTKGVAGEYVAFTVSEASTLLNLDLLGSIKVEAYNTAGQVIATKSDFGLADLKLLSGSTDKYHLGFVTPTGGYDIARLRLTMSGALLLLNSLNVYNAMHFKLQPNSVRIESTSANFCSGQNVILTAKVQDGSSILWSTGSTGDTIKVSQTGNYSFVATDAQGCQSTSSNITVTSLPTPTIAITNGATGSFCDNSTFTLTSTSSVGTTVQWSTGASTNDIVVNAAGTYTVTATHTNGCSESASINVSIKNSPQVSETVNHVTCHGLANGSIELLPIDNASNYTYAWNTSATTSTIDQLAPGVYTLDIEDADNSCVKHLEFTITQPNELALQGLTSNETCSGRDGQIELFTSGGTAPFSYNHAAINNNVFGGLVAGNYTVTVTDKNNCTATESFSISVANCNIALNIHNVITPNNDGLNEVMLIEGIENYPNSSLQIVNKWGDVVYSSNDYNNSWSGRNSDDSSNLPAGTYYYILKLSTPVVPNGERDYTGYVLIQ